MSQAIIGRDRDADLIPSNVKAGVTIYDTLGTYTGGGGAIFGGSYFYNYSLIAPTILIATFSDLNRPANSGEAGDFLCEYNNRVYYFYSQNTGNYSNGKIIGYIPQDGNSVTQIHTYGTSDVYTDNRTDRKKFNDVDGKIYYAIGHYGGSGEYDYVVMEIDLNTEVVTTLASFAYYQTAQYNTYRSGLTGTDISGTLTLDTSRGQTFEIKINVINWVAITGQTHMSIGGINISTT